MSRDIEKLREIARKTLNGDDNLCGRGITAEEETLARELLAALDVVEVAKQYNEGTVIRWMYDQWISGSQPKEKS